MGRMPENSGESMDQSAPQRTRLRDIRDSEDFLEYVRTNGKRVLLTVVGVIASFLCVWTSWYITPSQDNTVIQRFGAYVRTEEPGPHGNLPWPIETATNVLVSKVHRIEIGFRTNSDGTFEHVKSEDEMLTGDENIAHIDLVVQYRPADARKWLFNAVDPENALRLLSQSTTRLVVSDSTFDQIATTGRSEKQESIKRLVQELVNRPEIDLGIVVDNVQIQDVHPPEPVMAAFKDVSNAKEDQQKFIEQADGYRKQQIPQARGQAKTITEGALGYKTERINLATGDSQRFLGVLARYEQSPDLVRQRMRFEAIEASLVGKSQLIDRSNGNLLKFFDTNQVAAVAAAKK